MTAWPKDEIQKLLCKKEVEKNTEQTAKENLMIEFAEKLLGCKLYDHQKEVIRKLCESGPDDRYLVMCRHHGRSTIMDLMEDFHEIMKI